MFLWTVGKLWSVCDILTLKKCVKRLTVITKIFCLSYINTHTVMHISVVIKNDGFN